jgi:Protein of unknown function (DUF2892)
VEDIQMKLPQNVGPIDRVLRLAVGMGLVALAFGGALTGPVLYVAWVVAAIMLVTGAIGFCPLYFLLRISTVGNRLAFGRRSRA